MNSDASDTKQPGFFAALFGLGTKKVEDQMRGEPRLRTIILKSGERRDGRLLEETTHTLVLDTGRTHGIVRIPKETVEKVTDPSVADAARAEAAGAPGDEGTFLFGKKGPREWGKGDVEAQANYLEKERAHTQSVESMTTLRARIYACFLSPPPAVGREGADLADRALPLRDIVRGVLESEGVNQEKVSAILLAHKRGEVRAECNAMKDAKLLSGISAPNEVGYEFWKEAKDVYALTTDGAVQAHAVWEVSRRG